MVLGGSGGIGHCSNAPMNLSDLMMTVFTTVQHMLMDLTIKYHDASRTHLVLEEDFPLEHFLRLVVLYSYIDARFCKSLSLIHIELYVRTIADVGQCSQQ